MIQSYTNAIVGNGRDHFPNLVLMLFVCESGRKLGRGTTVGFEYRDTISPDTSLHGSSAAEAVAKKCLKSFSA